VFDATDVFDAPDFGKVRADRNHRSRILPLLLAAVL
jgi:hypothetical protein